MRALERLTLDAARFLSETYSKRPEVTATSQDFSWLGSLDHFDHLINDTILPAAAFRLVRDGSTIPARGYTRPFGGKRDDALRVADPALVFDWFSEGATIVFESLHRYSRPLRDLCLDLERELRQGTQVNAYVTPPNSLIFPTHVHSHDLFFLHLHGSNIFFVFPYSYIDGTHAPVI